MKKYFSFVFAVLTIMTGTGIVNAKCNDESIVAQAGAIETYSGAKPAVNVFEESDEIKIYVTNIPEETYIIAVNNTSNTKQTFKNIENGSISFNTPSTTKQYDYTIKVYSSNSACENELIKTLSVKSLVYNEFYNHDKCKKYYEESDNFDFDGCRRFSSKVYTQANFERELNSYLNLMPEEMNGKLVELFYKYYYFALVPIVVLGSYYIIRIIIIKRRKKKNESL